jgi:hypothetical protein|tara:strand:+ start:654 stop:893 length:240 start_codon:yes stop_codon:yes gene_type:complete
MIDKNYEIVNTIDADSLNHAEEYFVSRKQFVDKDTFDSLYKVLSKQEFNLNQEAFRRKPSSESIEWWKEEDSYLDMDKS